MLNASKNPWNQKQTDLFYSILIGIIICFGILVRLIQYFYNRSLWADEAVLALNIINRSYLELLQPLDYEQGAPIGFLILEKLAVQLFGNNEYALRLFPLLSSIAAFFIFYQLSKRCLRKSAMPIGLVLFATLPYLVYYASEVKQYSTDVAIALLCCLIAIDLSSPRLSTRKITLSLVGAIAVWFSHPAVFVLTGVSITSLIIGILKKEKIKINNILAICFTWLLSFTGFYFISLNSLGSSQDLLNSWQKKGAFPSSAFDIIWVFDSLGRLFSNPLGFPVIIDGLAILAFVFGCVSCFYRNKKALFILLSPLVVTLFAAYLHKYPFANRLLLFLTPFIIMLTAEGVSYFLSKRGNLRVFGILLLLLLLANPVINATTLLTKPYLREEIKSVISYVKKNQQTGDVLYIFQRGQYQFKYYAQNYGYQDGDYIIGVDDLDKYDGRKVSQAEWNRYKNDLDQLRGNKRVWLIFSHAYLRKENEMIKSYLDNIGKQIAFFETTGAFVYLYDLS